MPSLRRLLISCAALATACSGGQSFDDGGDPLKGRPDNGSSEAPTTPSSESPSPGADSGSESGEPAGAQPESSIPTASNDPSSTAEPDDESTDPEGSTASSEAGSTAPLDGGSSESPSAQSSPPDGGSSQTQTSDPTGTDDPPLSTEEDASSSVSFEFPEPPAGPESSLGSVAFSFAVQEPERYCRNSNDPFRIRVEDSEGRSVGVPNGAQGCGVLSCDSCQVDTPCDNTGGGIGDVYFPTFFGGGGELTWDGSWVSRSGCEADGETIACTAITYAPTGTYTAVFCAEFGEAIDSPPDECVVSYSGQDCVRVPFEYPAEQEVSALMPPGGDGFDTHTFPCGDTTCKQSESYCRSTLDGGQLVASCDPIPEQCLDDRSCACVIPFLEDGVLCREYPLDQSMAVFPE